MDITSLLLGLLAGAVLGMVGYGWWSRRSGADSLAPIREAHAQEKADLLRRLSDAEHVNEGRSRETMSLAAQLASEQQRAKGLLERLEQQKTELEQLHARMTTEFENIANRLLTQRGKELNEQQQEKLGTILKPLHEKIKDFEEQVRKTYQDEERERFSLKKEITTLVQQNQRLSQDADNLARALKGDSKAQGDWGEMILERMLESSGLVEGSEYTLQASSSTEEGSRLRPDAVINLPGEKHIVVDAKVSLTHYERYVSLTDNTERERYARAHTDSMRTHIKALSQKDYPNLYGISSPDIVLMFVPIEAAFNLAQQVRQEIVQEAIEQRVFIVTHSTLMASLKLFHSIWKGERIARNHLEIADRAGKLYDKFIGFTEDLIKVGNQLKQAKGSYDDAMGKLSEGSGNLIRQVEMIKELGAKTNKSQNDKLLQRALEE